MNWIILNKLNLDVWYRGNKRIFPTKISDNLIIMSNNDKIIFEDNKLYFNKLLISNITDITETEIYSLYIEYLTKKGYKFLNK